MLRVRGIIRNGTSLAVVEQSRDAGRDRDADIRIQLISND
jgi:hypothetical protein